jgi:hypothetical protein
MHTSCPSDDEIFAHAQGQVSVEASMFIRSHLGDREQCRVAGAETVRAAHPGTRLGRSSIVELAGALRGSGGDEKRAVALAEDGRAAHAAQAARFQQPVFQRLSAEAESEVASLG